MSCRLTNLFGHPILADYVCVSRNFMAIIFFSAAATIHFGYIYPLSTSTFTKKKFCFLLCGKTFYIRCTCLNLNIACQNKYKKILFYSNLTVFFLDSIQSSYAGSHTQTLTFFFLFLFISQIRLVLVQLEMCLTISLVQCEYFFSRAAPLLFLYRSFVSDVISLA